MRFYLSFYLLKTLINYYLSFNNDNKNEKGLLESYREKSGIHRKDNDT